MTALYARLRDIIANAQSVDMAVHEATPTTGEIVVTAPPPYSDVVPGWTISARVLRELLDDPECTVRFVANIGEAASRRKGMNLILRRANDRRVVSVERMDPRAPGGVNRTSTWVARLNTSMSKDAA